MNEKNLKIAFFNKQLPSDKPNGVSVQVHRLANELSLRGHLVTCFSFSPKPDNAIYNHHILESRAKSPLSKKFEAAFEFKKINCSKFDIVHFHGDDFLTKGKVNRVRTFYGSALNEALHAKNLKRFTYQSLFYLFEWISLLKKGYTTGISTATKRALPPIKQIIHCGVPEDIFFPVKSKSKEPSILFIGDLNSRKRGSLLLNIFNNKIRPLIPECTLTIIGPEKCTGDNIRYLGQISEEDLIKEYQKAWIYCMPSSYEGFGVPAIEAMACNTAVVSTKNAATNEIIINNQNGIVTTEKKLGNDLIRLVNDSTLFKKITKEGLNTFKHKFTIKKAADSYEAIYYSILNKNND